MYPIEFTHVSKQFVIHRRRNRSFQDVMVNLFRPSGISERFWALQDVSFAVKEGETLGIIGENGSGKSTILKLISRILEPNSGSVLVRGQVAALLELGAGFHPDLSGRDNIFLNSSILGLSRREIAPKVPEIVRFAQLERFIDEPIRHYSSGMFMRLAFGIATSANPEILLVDEILAVGDEASQRRCVDRMYEMRSRCKAIVFVSHDLPSVRDLCTRVIWLDRGRIGADGSPDEVVDQYLEAVNDDERIRLEPEINDSGRSTTRWGSWEVEITEVDFLSSQNQVRHVFSTGEKLTARIRFRASRRIDRPVFGVAIYREDGTHINGRNTRTSGFNIDFLEGEGEVRYVIPSLPLLEGIYRFSVTACDHSCTHIYDHHDRAYSFKVNSGSSGGGQGTFLIPSRWELEGACDNALTD